MRKRNVVIIVLLIIAAVALYFSFKHDKNREMHGKYLFKNLKFKDITEISVKNFVAKRFVLKKNNKGEWVTGGKERKCNKYKIAYLINILKDTDFGNIISDKKEKYENFNVDDKNSIKVIIKTIKKTIPLWIGKFTPDGNGCYVRLEDGKVYIVTKNLTYEFDRKRSYFYLEQHGSKHDNSTKSDK